MGVGKPMLMLQGMRMTAQRMTVSIQRMPVAHAMGVTAKAVGMPAQGVPVSHAVTVTSVAAGTPAGAAASGIPGDGHGLAVVGGHTAGILSRAVYVMRMPNGQGGRITEIVMVTVCADRVTVTPGAAGAGHGPTAVPRRAGRPRTARRSR